MMGATTLRYYKNIFQMNKKVITSVLILAALIGGFYYRNDLLNFYNNFGKTYLQSFQKTDLGKLINQIKDEVLTPSPLNIGGKENQVVLSAKKVIAETNIQRYDNETLPPLIENAKLDASAKAKANDMFAKQYFEHVSPTGVGPGELAKTYGYSYIVEGENLILGNFASEKEVVQKWMDSPGHRANILNNRYTEIGVAMVKGEYQEQMVWIGVQEFGLPLSSCPEPNKSIKTTIDANQSKLDQLNSEINAKKAQIDSTNQKSPQYNDLVNAYNQLVSQYNALAQETKNIILQYNVQVNTFNQCVAGN